MYRKTPPTVAKMYYIVLWNSQTIDRSSDKLGYTSSLLILYLLLGRTQLNSYENAEYCVKFNETS